MDIETTLPSAEQAGASEAQTLNTTATEPANQAETEGGKSEESKPEKTPEQREADKAQKAIDRRTRQLYQAREELAAYKRQVEQNEPKNNGDDSETVTLTRSQIDAMVREQAQNMAPEINEQRNSEARYQKIAASLEKEMGLEKLNEVAGDLEDVFGGLQDRTGAPKESLTAVMESDNPRALLEYLTDPENADFAERLSTMTGRGLGREIAKLELEVKAAAQSKKPKPSNAPSPIAAAKGGGVTVDRDPSKMTDAEYTEWRTERRKSKS